MSDASVTRREVLGALGSLGVLASTGLAADADMQAPSSSPTTAAARRAELYGLLGRLPDRARPVSGEKLGEVERDGYILETWRYDLNGIEPVPGYVARPKGLTGRAPGVVFCHSHGGGYTIGKTGVRRGPQLPAADAVRQGADRPRATSPSASTPGSSASAATPPSSTCSRRCC